MTRQTASTHRTYLENRAKSTLYRWYSIFDQMASDPAPLADVLGEGFSLHFPRATVTNWDELRSYYAKEQARSVYSSHHVRGFCFDRVDDTRLVAQVDVYWDVEWKGEPRTSIAARLEVELEETQDSFMRIVTYKVVSVAPWPS